MKKLAPLLLLIILSVLSCKKDNNTQSTTPKNYGHIHPDTVYSEIFPNNWISVKTGKPYANGDTGTFTYTFGGWPLDSANGSMSGSIDWFGYTYKQGSPGQYNKVWLLDSLPVTFQGNTYTLLYYSIQSATFKVSCKVRDSLGDNMCKIYTY